MEELRERIGRDGTGDGNRFADPADDRWPVRWRVWAGAALALLGLAVAAWAVWLG